jgi:hypothetical protein
VGWMKRLADMCGCDGEMVRCSDRYGLLSVVGGHASLAMGLVLLGLVSEMLAAECLLLSGESACTFSYKLIFAGFRRWGTQDVRTIIQW